MINIIPSPKKYSICSDNKCWNSEESTCDYEEFRVKFDGIYHKLARILQER